MVKKIAAADLNSLLEGNNQFALIDVREAGEYNSTHIIDSSLIPRRHLESQMSAAADARLGRRPAGGSADTGSGGFWVRALIPRPLSRWEKGDPDRFRHNIRIPTLHGGA